MKTLLLILLLTFSVNMQTPRNIQSPHTANTFWANWSSVTPRVCLCIKITPSAFWENYEPIGITTNSRDMTLAGHSGVTFKAKPAITPSDVEQILGEAGNGEFTGIYQDGEFERDDVLNGVWTNAEIEVFSVSWQFPEYGELVHLKGRLGEVKDYQTFFRAEVRGLIALLSNDVTVITQRSCRVKKFRDSRCGHTASTVTIDGTLYNIQEEVVPDGSYASTDTFIYFEASEFTVPPRENLFKNGTMEFLTGTLQGVSREIAYNSGVVDGAVKFQLKRPFFKQIGGFETVLLTVGCNRTMEDCRKFSNAENFDGEPYVPTIEVANRINSGN